ncbi:hypothetical protein FB45DRAFT_977269 [Roridomyces roridus]|uniref:GATA-type domain-containing protein n=1 Tax=Roridomyces roridus TaxID=1738132 RepID=A0AAD7C173_9AGAR|nr:hypothetical protein FB45DRAFT_977269 [Roridomyces roridus]
MDQSYPIQRSHTPSPYPTTRYHNPEQALPPHMQGIQIPEASTQDTVDGVKRCANCRTTSTPVWRRDPQTSNPLCNACGLYLIQRQQHRPQALIDVDNEEPNAADSEGEYTGPECTNCGTRRTSTWRRSKSGQQLCNACGVYERTNGKPRPLALRNDKIRPREKQRRS